MAFEWTDDFCSQLQEYWGNGLSAREIAGKFGNALTRCAVIGKARRLGLPARKRTHPMDPKEKKPKVHRVRFVERIRNAVVAETEAPINPPVAIMDLQDHHCRYPAGHGADCLMLYCGAEKVRHIAGSKLSYMGAYCPYHALKCYSS